MIRIAARKISVSVVLGSLLLAGCGGSKVSGASQTWAEDLCSNVTSLGGVSDAAVKAALAVDATMSAADTGKALSKPLKSMQDGIVALDEVFSSGTIVNTPMENVRNQIGKQLKNVYPAYDAVDAFTSAIAAAGATGSITKQLGDLQTALGTAKQGVADLGTAVGTFIASKDKDISKAFNAGPQCKKFKS